MTGKRIAMDGVGVERRRRRVLAAAAAVTLVAGVAVAVPRIDRDPQPPQVLDITPEPMPSASAEAEPTPAVTLLPSAPASVTDEPSEEVVPPTEPPSESSESSGSSTPTEPPTSNPPGPTVPFEEAFSIDVTVGAERYFTEEPIEVHTTVCNVSGQEQTGWGGGYVNLEFDRLDGPETHMTGHTTFEYADGSVWPAGWCDTFEGGWNHAAAGAAPGVYVVHAQWDGAGGSYYKYSAKSEPFEVLQHEDDRFDTVVSVPADAYAHDDVIELTLTTCNVSGDAATAKGELALHRIEVGPPGFDSVLAFREIEPTDHGRVWAAGECRANSVALAAGDADWTWPNWARPPEVLPRGQLAVRGTTVFAGDTDTSEHAPTWYSVSRIGRDSAFGIYDQVSLVPSVTTDAQAYRRDDTVTITVTICNVTDERFRVEGDELRISLEAMTGDDVHAATRWTITFDGHDDPRRAWASGECRDHERTWSGDDRRWSWDDGGLPPDEALPDGEWTINGWFEWDAPARGDYAGLMTGRMDRSAPFHVRS